MKRGKIFLQEIRKNRVLYLMAIPAVLYFVIFAYGPMAGVYLAFTKYNFKQGIFGSPFRSVYKELHADHETGAADNK